jgi:hypothetical protein
MRENCILDLDSPSYPPEFEEYVQCGCKYCLMVVKEVEMARTTKELEKELEEAEKKYPTVEQEEKEKKEKEEKEKEPDA